MSRLLLDAGAFIAFERGDAWVRARLAAAHRLGLEVATTSPVLAQVWRDGRRQALVARLVAATRVDAPDGPAARRAGALLGTTRTNDVVDALLADLADHGDVVLTSDPAGLKRLLSAATTKASVVTV